MPSLYSLLVWIPIGAGVAFVILALLQMFRASRSALRIAAWALFAVLLAGIAFGKYYAGTAPRRLEPIEASQPAVALSGYNEAIRLSPNDAELYFRRGRTDFRLRRYAEAVEDFTKALDLSPRNPRYLMSRIEAFLFLHDFTAAQRDLSQAIAQGYSSVETTVIQALLAEMRGQFGEAVQLYTEALSRSEINATDRCFSLLNRGYDYDREGKDEAAIADYTAAYTSCNDSYTRESALVDRGAVFARRKQYNAALADWDAALMINPNDPAVLINRGSILLNLGEYQRALSDFNRYIELRPDDPHAYISRSSIYTQLGEPSQAAEDLKSAQDLFSTKHARLYSAEMETPFGIMVPPGTGPGLSTPNSR